MMIAKRLSFLVPLIFNFCSFSALAQDSKFSFKLSADSVFLIQAQTNEIQEADNNDYLKPASLIAPASLLVYSGLKPFVEGIPKLDNKIMSDISKRHPNFHTNAEDYLTWAPSTSVYLLDAFKVETAHSFTEHLAIDAGSILITGGIGYGMRIISSHINAYKSAKTEFPSGHTANAFRGAEILHQELKNLNPVWSYSGYFVAAGVGVLRMYNQQHFFTEVVAGAGLGIISTKLTYWLFNKLGIIN